MENNYDKVSPKDIEKCLQNFILTSACTRCSHKEVCSLKDKYEKNYIETHDFCKHFIDSIGYKTYSSIYDMFLPIFDWLKYHYPSGEARFIVEQNKAQMVLEHGVSAFSKEIRMCSEDPAKCYQENVNKEN